MEANGGIRWWVIVFVWVVLIIGYAAGPVRGQIVQEAIDGFFVENVGKVEAKGKIDSTSAVKILETDPMSALGMLGGRLSDEKRSYRILAATLLYDLLKALDEPQTEKASSEAEAKKPQNESEADAAPNKPQAEMAQDESEAEAAPEEAQTEEAQDESKAGGSSDKKETEKASGVVQATQVSNILDDKARENFPIFEALKKNMMNAFQQDDQDLKDLIYKGWLILFPGQNLFAEAPEKTVEPGYRTSYFFLHAGAVMLNPYTITDDTGVYILESSGEADERFFMEAMYRNRYAWLDKTPKKWYQMLDYEMRLGVAGSDSDPSGAVVSGAGDAYMEFSVGKVIPKVNNLGTALDEGVRWTFNLEGLAGFVTDKGAQDIHYYWGIGPAVAVGLPYIKDSTKGEERKIEVLGGVFFGKTDMPQFVDDNSPEVQSEKGFPKFRHEWSAICRGDIHFPFGENGFVTIAGRFTLNLHPSDINPWNIAIGYTIPVEVITDSVTTLFKQ